MTRPKNSSYRSYQMLYQRLLKGPMWIGDWRSTGLKSRSTVHQRLKHLKSLRLVAARKEGHKILFELCPLQKSDGIVTMEGINWQWLLYPITRKELRHSRRRYLKTLVELSKLEKESKSVRQYWIGILDEQAAMSDSSRGREICEILKKLGLDIDKIPIHKLLHFLIFPSFNETLCLCCLRQGRITYLIFDNKTGEVFCPVEGIVTDVLFEEHSRFVLPRQKWTSHYKRKTVDIECPNCHHRNRVRARQVFVDEVSKSGTMTAIPTYDVLQVAHCVKCKKIIAEPRNRRKSIKA